MNSNRCFLLAVVTAVVVTGSVFAADKPDDAAKVRDAIAKQNAAYIAAVNKSDAAALVDLFTDDATVMLIGKTIKGKQSIQKHAEAIGKEYRNDVFKSLDVEVRDDLAYEVGEYAVETVAGRKSSGTYLAVWKKQAHGKWKIHVEATLPGKE